MLSDFAIAPLRKDEWKRVAMRFGDYRRLSTLPAQQESSMLRLTAATVAVAVLTTFLTDQVHGQIKRPPFDPSKVIAPPEGVKPKPKKELLGTLDIKRFDAKRDAQGISITGEIRNTQASGADSVVTWSILRQNGKAWTRIKTGKATVKGYSTLPVTAMLPVSNEAQRLRFDVSSSRPSLYTTKEYNLSAREVAAETASSGGTRPTNAPDTGSAPTSATLTLLAIHCNHTEDSGNDELEMRIYYKGRNGRPGENKLRFEMDHLRKNHKVFESELRWRHRVGDQTRIQLWELDSPDKDDLLGSVLIRTDEGFGDRSFTFDNDDLATYVLYYRLER